MSFLKTLPRKLTHLLNFNKLQVSYAQEAEDLVLERIFPGKQKGFFVDVGAYHPIKYSNTFRFYVKGWRGINIDAMPGSMDAFKRKRPGDTNLEAAVSDTSEELTYHVFNEQGINTFSKEEADKKNGLQHFRLLKTIPIVTQTLSSILDKHAPLGTEIDFLSVDAEGFDLKVLMSNDWNKYRPKVILIENLGSSDSLESAVKSEVNTYLSGKGYILFAKTYNTIFFHEQTYSI